MSELKKTPLYPEYETFQVKTIDFGGWDLPVQFSSIIREHELTRTKSTLFDVSHMGEIFVKGKDSLNFLQRLVTNDVGTLTPNRAQYSFMCNEHGGTIDDLIIYMLDDSNYLLVVNAANTEKDFAWLNKQKLATEEVALENVSDQYALLAVQGPESANVIQQLTNVDVRSIRPFNFQNNVTLHNISQPVLLSRTGYTGEDGFEIYIPPEVARDVWKKIIEVGKSYGLEPAGLGARDTLRFEAGLPLYGQELSETISPFEAGLDFAVKLNKTKDFIGKNALFTQKEKGILRKLVGIEMIDKGIPRTGYEVFSETGENIGYVTSGTVSPTLKKNIGFVLIDKDYALLGTPVIVQIRKRQLKAKVVATPFYRRTT